MRKILSLLLIVILLLCAGCSEKTSNNSSNNDSKTDSHIDDSPVESNSKNNADYDVSMQANNKKKPPNEKFITNDLKKNNINSFELNYCYERLDVDSVKIIKRKTDNNVDTVYVSVVFKNSYYTVNAEITMYYSFYTVGGWILDYHEITTYESYANKPYYSDDDFKQLLLESFSDGKIISRDHGVNSNGNYYDNISFSGALKYNYLTTNITGSCCMIFENDVWSETIVLNSVSNDWSKMIGTWGFIHDNGDNIVFKISNITDIDGKKYRMNYSYTTSLWKWLDLRNESKFREYTETNTRELSYSTEKIYVFGLEIEIPKKVSLPVNLGGDISLGTHGVFLDRDDGGVLEAVESLYYGGAKIHNFTLTKK